MGNLHCNTFSLHFNYLKVKLKCKRLHVFEGKILDDGNAQKGAASLRHLN